MRLATSGEPFEFANCTWVSKDTSLTEEVMSSRCCQQRRVVKGYLLGSHTPNPGVVHALTIVNIWGTANGEDRGRRARIESGHDVYPQGYPQARAPQSTPLSTDPSPAKQQQARRLQHAPWIAGRSSWCAAILNCSYPRDTLRHRGANSRGYQPPEIAPGIPRFIPHAAARRFT
jgi:hypothetical protein